jgi:hypothetical protein
MRSMTITSAVRAGTNTHMAHLLNWARTSSEVIW